MRKIIVITGRGGAGKSTFTTLFTRYINAKLLLLIDLDPDGSLAKMLGVDLEKEGKMTVSDALYHVFMKGKDNKGKDDTPELLKLMIEGGDIIYRDKKFDLLTLGTKFAPGCYCLPDEMIKAAIAKIGKNYEMVVVDSPAGLEHLNRKVTPDIDDLFVILDPSEKSAKHIERIKYVARGVKINYKNFYLIGNHRFTPLESPAIYDEEGERKCPFLIDPVRKRLSNGVEAGVKNPAFLTGFTDEAEAYLLNSGEKYLGRIEYDPLVREHNLKGESLLKIPEDSPASLAIKKILLKAGYQVSC